MGSRLFTLSPPCISHILKQFFCKKIVIPAQAGTGSKKLLTLLNFFPQNKKSRQLAGVLFVWNNFYFNTSVQTAPIGGCVRCDWIR